VGADGTKSSAGAAYVYGRNQNGNGDWGLAQSISGTTKGGQLGAAVAVNGGTLALGVDGSGTSQAVQIWERNSTGAWQNVVSVADPLATAGSNDWFGSAVAVYGDTLIVGAYGSNSFQGAATLYNRNQGGIEKWRTRLPPGRSARPQVPNYLRRLGCVRRYTLCPGRRRRRSRPPPRYRH